MIRALKESEVDGVVWGTQQFHLVECPFCCGRGELSAPGGEDEEECPECEGNGDLYLMREDVEDPNATMMHVVIDLAQVQVTDNGIDIPF